LDAYDQIERRFDALDAWTKEAHPEYSDRLWGIASLSLYGTKKTRFMYDVLRRSFPDARTVCELGFNAGHSALLFLETLPQARIYSFDLCDQLWTLRNADYLAALYPDRFELIMGDSAETVPAFASRGIQCDVVFIDGSKDALHRRNDMTLFRQQLASGNALVFLDEVSSEACIRGDSPCQGTATLNEAYRVISEMYLSLVKEEQLFILECSDTMTEDDYLCVGAFQRAVAASVGRPAPSASVALLPALSTTVVSGYWDIASKHLPQDYRAWFKNTLRVNAGMVFFYEDEAVRRSVADIRRDLLTVFIQLALSDLAAVQLYNPDWVHARHVPTPELGTIWLQKVSLVQRAAHANPFNSSWFAWMDAGCAVYRERPPGDKPWPDMRALERLPRDRIIYTHVQAWYHHFAGTAYLVHLGMVAPLRERFDNEVKRCAAALNAWPCGHDQYIMTQLLDRNPAAFYKLGDGYGDLMLLLAAASGSPPPSSLPPPSPPPPSSSSADLHAYNELKSQMNLLRSIVAEAVCKDGNEVAHTGAWCLLPDGDKEIAPGYPLAINHLPVDTGLALFFLKLFKDRSILDLGAGIGQYGHFFLAANGTVKYTGVDGALNVVAFTKGFISWVDLTLPIPHHFSRHDWVICLEVGEHVPHEYQEQVLDHIHSGNRCGVALSWAVPGQNGHSHVNLKTNEEVIDMLHGRGYTFDERITKLFRLTVTDYGWFRNTFMFFRRNGSSSTSCELPALE